jgi:beta-lactamase superfamily II metal-dependent hydrolase
MHVQITDDGTQRDVIAPAQRALQRDQRQLSVAILLTYDTGRLLSAGNAEATEEEYMATDSYTRP